jgi:hypothetical protein
MRQEIKLEGTVTDLLVLMGEGNPGALRVLADLYKCDNLHIILFLDDMNIRGTQVWVAFKDFAKENLYTLAVAVDSQDPELIRVVNEVGRQGNHPHLAVLEGARENRKVFEATNV